MSLEAEVIEAVRKRLEDKRLEAEENAQLTPYEHDEQYENGRRAAFEYALQIIKTEMGRRGLK